MALFRGGASRPGGGAAACVVRRVGGRDAWCPIGSRSGECRRGERGVPAQLSGWARPERSEVSVDVDSCLFQRLRGAETAWGRGPEAAWGCEAAWDFPPVTGCGCHGVACLMVCWTECEG